MVRADSTTLAHAVARLAARDATLFADAEIAAERLGWIGLPAVAARSAAGLSAFGLQVVERGITDVVLLGMGGSSLAPLVLARVIGSADGHPALHVLDTTSPEAVSGLIGRLNCATTLVLVSSKSGTTIEPLSLAAVFLKHMEDELGGSAGEHFIAITDPGSPLEDYAEERGFARVFHAPSDLGGRYAALSAFATVPAALLGIDVAALAAYAIAAEEACSKPGQRNPAQALAAWISDAYADGRDKLTLVCSPSLAPFGLWVEQLVAESTGKRGGGVLPVLESAPGLPGAHGPDRLTFILRTDDDDRLATLPDRLPKGEPVFESVVDDVYALGAQFVWWEWAVALACALNEIEPFDQPDVEVAKSAVRRIAHGDPAACLPVVLDDDIAVSSALPGHPAGVREALALLLAQARPGSYLALLAYLPEDEALLEPLRAACDRLSARTRLAITFELGPRYLHSTGQYHKGGPEGGLFLVVTSAHDVDLPVPGARFSLARLNQAQAAGDMTTLAALGRPVVSIELPSPEPEQTRRLAEALESLSL